MVKSCCFLHNQFHCEYFAMGRDVHHNVPCLQTAILLVCDACEFFISLHEDMGVMFRFPRFWTLDEFLLQLIVVAGMGPVLALKYFRYTYRSSAINILQQAEYSRSRTSTLANIEHQLRVIEKEASPLSTAQSKSRTSVYEPLLHDSPSTARRSFGSSTAFEFFQSPSRLSSNYSRNCKDN